MFFALEIGLKVFNTFACQANVMQLILSHNRPVIMAAGSGGCSLYLSGSPDPGRTNSSECKAGVGKFFFYSYQVPFEFYNILSDPYKMTERSYHTNAMGGNAFLWRDL